MEIVKLADKSTKIQITPDDALQRALDSKFRKDACIILLYDDENPAYEFWIGGNLTNAEILWHLEEHKRALMIGRRDEK